MRAIRRFTVRPVLPESLRPLEELATNLRWSWHPETQDLFEAMDPRAWERSGHDPVRFLGAIAPDRLKALGKDKRFIKSLQLAHADLEEYLTGDRWYQGLGAEVPRQIAYFSPEFGIAAVLPQYSGGLGILAGDHLKTASDLGVPIIGVGLLYRHGYFRQLLSGEGWQQERYPITDPDELPLRVLRENDNAPLRITIALPGGQELLARIWVAQVGRVPLLLLDSDIEAERRAAARGHGPVVRRWLRAPAAAGGAARDRRHPGDPRLLPDHRGARARGVPHQRGPCRVPRPGADPRVRLRAGAGLRRGARAGPRGHGLHDAHPGAGRHRPVPARADRVPVRPRQPVPGAAGQADPRPRRRELPGRRPVGVQHGRDGHAPGRSGQRRQPAARARVPRDVRGALAGLRRATTCRSPRSPTGSMRRPGWPARCSSSSRRSPCCREPRSRRLERRRHGARRADLEHQAGAAPAAGRRRARPGAEVVAAARREPGRARLGRLGARPRRADDRLRAPRAVVQAAHPDAARPRAAQEAAARPGAADPAGHRRQGAPRRRGRQEADPGDRPVLRRPRGPAPDRLPAQLRHRDGAAALSRLRRLAEQPAPAVRGLRHVRA